MTLIESHPVPRDRACVLESILRVFWHARHRFIQARLMVRELVAEIRAARALAALVAA